MQFHLNFQPAVSNHKINHQQELLFIGSCFSEHIADKLHQLQFNVSSNPFGILFNPISIATSISRIIHKHLFTDKDVFEKNGLWFCLEISTKIFAETKEGLVSTLNTIILAWHEKLKQAKWLVFTFGSAYAYKHIEQHKIVANCHKLPQHLFQKELIDTKDIVTCYAALFSELKKLNPQLSLLLTVSPVKHLRDGIIENTLSKSILIQAVHQLLKEHQQCHYFPSYELVIDDLRDYRFFEKDLAHPNAQAIEYVWRKFESVYFTKETSELNKEIEAILLAKKHQLLQPNSAESIAFEVLLRNKIKALNQKHPWLTF